MWWVSVFNSAWSCQSTIDVNGLVGVACVNPLQTKNRAPASVITCYACGKTGHKSYEGRTTKLIVGHTRHGLLSSHERLRESNARLL